ncbi:sugar transferase [Pikeienuella piscinae]|uniref:Sugar transferase n=1 Tax=Pikeienuella piscinae TaxID=2748098 RepID=A0A7M3T770_9RHOB|nr:sugar transferase [Pikeienuella piscinae]
MVVSILCLPLFLGLCCVLIVLNPFWNPGELFYLQRRMGKDRKGFIMLKFRSMTRENNIKRGADDPLETSRITPLGRWLRRSKADELPQILNVLLGEMSLIGPRPEVFSFAQTYRSVIPDYSIRESVRPGMTGYAQVKQGYTDTIEMARRKADLDAFYVRNMGWRLDLYVLAGTIAILYAPCKTRQ